MQDDRLAASAVGQRHCRAQKKPKFTLSMKISATPNAIIAHGLATDILSSLNSLRGTELLA